MESNYDNSRETNLHQDTSWTRYDILSVIVITLGYSALSGIVSIFGIVTNVINLIIFMKQGLDTTTNISFFALALSDLLSLISLLTSSLFMMPLGIKSNIPIYVPETKYLISDWPHACFGHITCWITAYITAERCLCIAFPLKIKQIVTPKRTTILLCVMYVLNITALIPDYSSMYYDWKFFPDRNRSLLALAFKENREDMKIIGFVILAVLGMLSFPAVIIFTVVLIVKMKQQTSWRNKSTTGSTKSEAITKRDLKTMNLVILIAIILILCYTPGVIGSFTTCFLPGFEITGDKVKLFLQLWGYMFALEAVNSSVNIFLYYKMSTKFRITFDELFGKCLGKKSTNGKHECAPQPKDLENHSNRENNIVFVHDNFVQ